MLHELLRHATADVHARVEARMPLLDPALTADTYGGVVARLHAFHSALEPALARWGDSLATYGVDLDRRAKLPLLAHDAAALGVVPPSPSATLSADAAEATATLGRAMGALYVVEGATLGGQVVQRSLARSVGDDAAKYFASYGESVGPMWRAFQKTLAAFDTVADDEVVQGALATFAAFERHVVDAELATA